MATFGVSSRPFSLRRMSLSGWSRRDEFSPRGFTILRRGTKENSRHTITCPRRRAPHSGLNDRIAPQHGQ